MRSRSNGYEPGWWRGLGDDTRRRRSDESMNSNLWPRLSYDRRLEEDHQRLQKEHRRRKKCETTEMTTRSREECCTSTEKCETTSATRGSEADSSGAERGRIGGGEVCMSVCWGYIYGELGAPRAQVSQFPVTLPTKKVAIQGKGKQPYPSEEEKSFPRQKKEYFSKEKPNS
ncbi:hypothetical protein PIB30_050211 [Stylosanthes scabra]|uniref:Uncharacterized protein n=1 Tax=Stylosanthes scabra TaxID=79078 RepID=A0ABU6VID7_9FABA|nr:hypothetical protein [Stylosanthes scabra]